MGGGTGGGGTGGGGPLDTYVCVTCAGSNDANTGTRASPLRTINRGIVVAQLLGRPKVFVGSSGSTTYAENLFIPNGVTVEGKWRVTNGTWTRGTATSTRTVLLNGTAPGVTFAPGATSTAGIDGFQIQSAGAVAGATSSAAITVVNASPTITDVQTIAPATNAPVPQFAAGIVISSTLPARSRPIIRGPLAPSTDRSEVVAGPATSSTFGIAVFDTAADISGTNARGGSISASATTSATAGVYLSNASNTSFRAGIAAAGSARTCAGFASQGSAAGVVVEGAEVRGCEQSLSGGQVPVQSFGVSFVSCTPVGLTEPRLSSSTVRGGAATGTGSSVIGVYAGDGCALAVSNNTSIIGSTGMFTFPVTAVGVSCGSEAGPGMAGIDSACRVTGNASITSGTASGSAVGVACAGRCARATATCAGSCAEISTNELIQGDNAPSVIHVSVVQSSPRIARNQLGGQSANCNFGGTTTALVGLRLEGSSSRVENNIIIGGQCQNVFGLEQVNAARADGSFPAPDVQHNTIFPVTQATPGFSTVLVGVALRSSSTGVRPTQALGTYRSNIISAVGNASTRFAFQEADAVSDPAVLANNDFFIGISPGSTPLYQNEGTTTLSGAAVINALAGAASNLAIDPQVLPSLRLTNGSAMRGQGSTVNVPNDDIDGDLRPSRSAPDIGADEVP